MANKTRMRLGQITGSFSTNGADAKGSIITQAGKASLAQLNVKDLSLSGSLSAMASAIQRIHGKASGEFANNDAGVFYQAIIPDSVGGRDIGSTSAEWGDIFVADGKALKLGSGQEHSIGDSAAGLTIGSSQAIKIGVDANTQAIDIGTINQAKTITVGNDASTKVDINALEIELDAATGVTIDSAGTDADAIDINSAGGIDVDAADAISLTTTSADGHIELVSAHTAGVAFHLDADAHAGAIVDIDAGILQIDAAGVAGINSAGTLSLGTANSGVAVNIGHGTSEVTVGDNLTVSGDATITGDLTVNGTTTQLDVTNLNVEDPFILMGGKAVANSNTGLIFMSGSSTGAARPDVTFARVANDIWGLGSIASNSGSITNATGMTHDIAFRSQKFEIFEAATVIKQTANDLHIEADTNIRLDVGSGNKTQFRFAGTALGQVQNSSNKLVISSSIDQMELSAPGGVRIKDWRAGTEDTVAEINYNGTSSNYQMLFDSSAGAVVSAGSGRPLAVTGGNKSFLELGIDDNTGRAHLSLSGTLGAKVSTLVVNPAAGEYRPSSNTEVLKVSGSILGITNGAGANGSQGRLALYDVAAGQKFIAFRAPPAVTTDTTLTLPDGAGTSGQVLTTDGANPASLSWADATLNTDDMSKKLGTLARERSANTAVDFGEAADFAETTAALNYQNTKSDSRVKLIDVFVNGQMLMTGTSAPGVAVAGGDYVMVDNAGGSGAGSSQRATIKFAFDLEIEDVVQVIVRG